MNFLRDRADRRQAADGQELSASVEVSKTASLRPATAEARYACVQCGGKGEFGYRNSEGELVWYCADHRLAQCWADARIPFDGETPSDPAEERQVVPRTTRLGTRSIEKVRSAAACEPHNDTDGRFIHYCCRCGKEASFGFGVSLREGKFGTWYCAECKSLRRGSSQ
jgi:hypothetical protein